MANFVLRLRAAFTSIFGRVSWEAPGWLKRVPVWIAAARGWIARHSRVVIAGCVGFVLFFTGGLALRSYLAHRPKPVSYSFRGNGPGLTRLEDNARPDPIELVFDGSVARLEDVGKPVKLVTMSPMQPGSWSWTNDRTLHFTPTQDWPVGQDFTVTIDPKLFPPHIHVDAYEWEFKTAGFSLSMGDSSFYQDPRDPKVKQAIATITFSHPVDPAELEKRITVTMAGRKKPLTFTVSYDKFRGQAFVKSEPVEIPADDTSITISVSGGVKAAKGGPPAGGTSASVPVPGLLNFFRIAGANPVVVGNERYQPEEVVILQTTASVLEKDMAKSVQLTLLPKDLPARQGQEAQKDYYWSESDVTHLGPDIFALSSSLTPAMIPSDREHSTQFSFKYKAPVGRYVHLKIKKGLASFGGYLLAKDYETIFQVPPIPDELKVMHSGAVLSLKGEKKLTILSRGLDGVHFEVGRVLPDRINHLVSQTQGDFRHPVFGGSSYYGGEYEGSDYEGDGYAGSNYYGGDRSSGSFGELDITERKVDERPIVRTPGSIQPQFSAFDLGPYVAEGKKGLFFFKASAWDPRTKTVGSLSDSRFVVVTDLGLLVKDDADLTHDVFVQSIHDGKPVAGATVEVLGRNGIPVASVTTDSSGHARVDSLAGFGMEKQPTAWIVRTADDLSFLPYSTRDRGLDVSRFDIGGVQGRTVAEGLNAFLFSDRGLYRPGDEVRVAMIVKHPEWSRPVAGIPLEVAVRDPRGLEVMTKKIALSPAGFEEIRYTPAETAPTGSYEFTIYIVRDGQRSQQLGSTKVRVEEFLPDRLRISALFSEERTNGWVKPEGLAARVHLENLFGTAAEDRKVTAGITLTAGYPSFAGFRDYQFFDPLKKPSTYTEELPEGATDENGDAEFDLGLDKLEKATYQVSFLASGFEAEGGRGVTTAAGTLVSPLDFLLGWKSDGDLGYVSLGAARALDVVAVSPRLERMAIPGLTATLDEEKWVSVLMRQPNGTYKYESVRKETEGEAKPLALADKANLLKLETKNPGDFALVIKDKDGTELLRVPYTVAGKANLTRSLDRNAELGLKLAKTDLSPGDDLEVEVKAPYTGSGLITIERDKVYAFQWFTASTTTTVQHIRVPDEMEGNGYLSVSFLRAPDSQEIFMSPLSYGVAPFSISRARRENKIELQTTDLARPGEPFKVSYKTSSPGKIVLFGVDEGILQVADYKTPDPLDYYFRKRALEVRTLQILDLVLPEYSLSQALAAQGGDEEAAAALARNLNPFKRKQDKPIAFWSGVIDSGPDARELTWNVPDYFNGSMRVMAIAVSTETMGATSKSVTVRGPFVLSPNAPTTVAPGDQFTASVGVANQAEGTGKNAKIDLAVTATGPLKVSGGATQTLAIAEGHEGSATVTLTATGEPGAGTIVYTATAGGKKVTRTIGVSVRPAIPYMTTVASGAFSEGKIDVPVPRKMVPQFRKLEVSASAVPLALGPGLVRYLEEYPYGCTEQLVSRAFPALVLRDKPELGYAPETVQHNLDRVVSVLRERQNAEGAFGFWAANSYVSDFQTVYATHFLIEAREHGYPVPPDLLQHAAAYVATLNGRGIGSLSDARLQAYALYVQARNGTSVGSAVAAFHQKLDKAKLKGWDDDAGNAYLAATHAILKQDKPAADAIRKVKLAVGVPSDYGEYYDTLSRNAQVLYLVSRHFPERLKDVQAAELTQIVQPLFDGRFNTLSSSYALLGLSAYTDVVSAHEQATLSIDELTSGGEDIPVVLPKGRLFPHVEFSDKAAKIRFAKSETLPAFWQVTQAGFDADLPKTPIKQKLEIQREFHDVGGKDPITGATLGDEIEVHLKIRSIDGGGYSNIAVVDLLPGGFEVVMNEPGSADSSENDQVTNDEEGGDGEGEGGESGDDESSEQEDTHKDESGADSYWSSTISQSGSTWTPEYVDVREDRVVLFGEATSDVQEFVYKIRATNKGAFVVPPPYAESMYDRDVRARGLPGKMEVE